MYIYHVIMLPWYINSLYLMSWMNFQMFLLYKKITGDAWVFSGWLRDAWDTLNQLLDSYVSLIYQYFLLSPILGRDVFGKFPHFLNMEGTDRVCPLPQNPETPQGARMGFWRVATHPCVTFSVGLRVSETSSANIWIAKYRLSINISSCPQF